ncbi:MAG: hypothetical protein IK079_01410 [Desulfovibrio sp.]|nr:hypothetical protein [Desulfovibrio sp.]
MHWDGDADLVEVVDTAHRILLYMPREHVLAQNLPHKVVILLLKASNHECLFGVTEEGMLDVPYQTICHAGLACEDEAQTLLEQAFPHAKAKFHFLPPLITDQNKIVLSTLGATVPGSILQRKCSEFGKKTYVLLDATAFANLKSLGMSSYLRLLVEHHIFEHFLPG